jgi:hypothetical protein
VTAKALHDLREDGPNFSRADHANSFAIQIEAHQFFKGEISFTYPIVRFMSFPIQG